jgi:phosphopantothenoylcysteine synthetase/decarboxylase
LIAANDVSSGVFGEEHSTVHIVSRSGAIATIQNQSKSFIADEILDRALSICQQNHCKKGEQ